MNVVVDGLMTNYEKVGKGGKAVILLHGWGDDLTTYRSLLNDLESKYTYYALDLPGFGGSEAPKSAWDLTDYANFVRVWQKKLRLKNIEAVIGHSFGGAVTIVGIGDGILSAKKVVLMASSGIRNKKSIRKSVYWLGAKVSKVPLYLMPASKATRVKKFFYSKAGSDILLKPQMRETTVKVLKHDVAKSAHQIDKPCLLIFGARDNSVPLEDGWVLHQLIKGSRLEVVEASHFLHQTNTAEVARLINHFLKSKK